MIDRRLRDMEKRTTEKKKKKQQPKQQLKRKKIISRFNQEEEEDVMIDEKPKRKKNFIGGLHREKLKQQQQLPEEEEDDDVMIGKIFLKLPEDVIEKILLKLPANSLSNLRYVSKYLWSLITNPSFGKLHLHHSSTAPQIINNHLLLISSHSCNSTVYYYKDDWLRPKHINHNYACNFTTTSTSSSSPEIVEMHCPFETTEIRASCNGLLYLYRRVVDDYDRRCLDILNYIWNPCTKEYKELPRPPPLVLPLLDAENNNYVTELSSSNCFYPSSSGFCGFGYDRTNDEYKILHYENLVNPTVTRRGFLEVEVTHVLSTVEFKLYTLGKKNTWTSIVDNPYKSFFFRERIRRIGLLVNGALHWIMCLSDPKSKGKIVSFDFGTQVFREVQKPHYYFSSREEDQQQQQQQYYESLQVLQECLCMCKVSRVFKIDIWMLRDYDVPSSWTKSFTVMPSDSFCPRNFTLLRYFEDSGEILMLTNEEVMIMYDPLNHKSRRATKFNESIAKSWLYFMDYTESIVSLNSGTYASS